MVRLVFRPLTHVRRTICTSVSLRASTRVSTGFTLRTLSSPSFGSHHVCSDSILSLERSVDAAISGCPETSHRSLSLCTWVFHPNTCKHNSLLGPCFKTGDMKPFRQHAEHADGVSLRQTVVEIYPASRHTPLAIWVHQLPRRGTCFRFPRSKTTYATRGYNNYILRYSSPSSHLSPPSQTDVDTRYNKVPPFFLVIRALRGIHHRASPITSDQWSELLHAITDYISFPFNSFKYF